MTSEVDFRFADVVLVPFPFTDQTGSKKRPAAVVSGTVYNANRRDLVIMAITSQLKGHPGYAEALLVEWGEAGLIKPSMLKPVLATIEQSLVLRKLGSLCATDQRALAGILDEVFPPADSRPR